MLFFSAFRAFSRELLKAPIRKVSPSSYKNITWAYQPLLAWLRPIEGGQSCLPESSTERVSAQPIPRPYRPSAALICISLWILAKFSSRLSYPAQSTTPHYCTDRPSDEETAHCPSLKEGGPSFQRILAACRNCKTALYKSYVPSESRERALHLLDSHCLSMLTTN